MYKSFNFGSMYRNQGRSKLAPQTSFYSGPDFPDSDPLNLRFYNRFSVQFLLTLAKDFTYTKNVNARIMTLSLPFI